MMTNPALEDQFKHADTIKARYHEGHLTMVSKATLQEQFKSAMRHVPAGVCIITSGRADERRGLTATAMCSVSADPPTLLVCVNRSAEAHPVITRERRFCVNILSAEDGPLADRFAALDGSKGVGRFSGRDWTVLGARTPALADALVSVECEMTESVQVATHAIFIGAVTAVRVSPTRSPLVYYDRKYRQLV
jgi:flavin reductase (DIM6/NTAB) family NADH-FMN oxidoreductase RutF